MAYCPYCLPFSICLSTATLQVARMMPWIKRTMRNMLAAERKRQLHSRGLLQAQDVANNSSSADAQ